MKLISRLLVNDEPVKLVRHCVFLRFCRVGMAEFVIESSAPLSGIVSFETGYTGQAVHSYFTGAIQNYVQKTASSAVIVCVELLGALSAALPLSLRNVSYRDVLRAISEKSGLAFSVPDKDYADVITPKFYSLSSGLFALSQLGRVFGVSDYVFQQSGDGAVFAGSWADSFWAGKTLDLPSDLVLESSAVGAATVPLVPGLRPGVRLASGEYVQRVESINNKAAITWSKRLKE